MVVEFLFWYTFYQMKTAKLTQKGFTIVELLVVIVVVGILSTISANAYIGAKSKAADSIRKNDLQAIMTAFEAFAVDEETYFLDTYGWKGRGQGWVNYKNASAIGDYQSTIIEGLADKGYPVSNARDPYISDDLNEIWQTKQAYMAYLCVDDGGLKIGLFAKLENPTLEDQVNVNKWLNEPCNPYPIASLGMNYVIESIARTPNNVPDYD